MAAKARLALDPVADLSRRLVRIAARPGPGGQRACVARWWTEHGFHEHPAAVGKRVALGLLEHKRPATKRAGVVVLHELLADHLRTSDLVDFEALFARGALAEASIVDWFGVKVLGTLLHRVRGRAEAARALVQWRNAESMWQRRAACVAFTALAPQGDAALPNLAQQIFMVCSSVVWSPDGVDQTAVGWLLRELSRAEPTRVEAFVRRHARFMSRECVRQAIEKLPAVRQQDLLAHWKRATTLAR
ncbi:MAG TPA: DNA alkylation repair protein [Kofleriaceae bacterium]